LSAAALGISAAEKIFKNPNKKEQNDWQKRNQSKPIAD
jgi:hypothetical protein